MAEVEYKGIRVGGSKLLLILPLIGTLGGGLWAGFEFYKDYMDMKKKILSYTAPDLSGFDKKLAVMNKSMGAVTKEMVSVRTRVAEVQTVVRDIREDTRADAGKLYSGLSVVAKRSRVLDAETREVMRKTEKNVRRVASNNEKSVRSVVESAATRLDNKINSANTRFDVKITQVDGKLEAMEKRLNKTVRRALDNPILRNK